MNILLNNLSKIFGIKQITTSGYRPQTNGSLERSHAVLMDYVRTYAENYDDWDQLLPFGMFDYNTFVHSATKFTPFELVFGKIAPTPSSFPSYEKLETYGSYLQELISRLTEIKNMAADNLINAKQNSKLIYDTKAGSFLGKVGDNVYVQKEIKKHGKFIYPKGYVENLRHPKGALEELLAGYGFTKPSYILVNSEGPAHNKNFYVTCTLTL